MSNVNEFMSTVIWIRIVLYLVWRLMRDSATRALADQIRPMVATLEAAAAATESAVRGVMFARASVETACIELADRLRDFELDLLKHVKRNRRHESYAAILPDGLTPVIRSLKGTEASAARRVEEAIVRTLPGIEFAQKALESIREAREEVERQQKALAEAVEALRTARAAERSRRVQAMLQYRTIFAELLKLFPRDQRRARSYFYRPRSSATEPESGDGSGRGRKDAAPAADGAPPDAPPSAAPFVDAVR